MNKIDALKANVIPLMMRENLHAIKWFIQTLRLAEKNKGYLDIHIIVSDGKAHRVECNNKYLVANVAPKTQPLVKI